MHNLWLAFNLVSEVFKVELLVVMVGAAIVHTEFAVTFEVAFTWFVKGETFFRVIFGP